MEATLAANVGSSARRSPHGSLTSMNSYSSSSGDFSGRSSYLEVVAFASKPSH